MKYAFLVWKNLWRRRTRTILTVLSVLIAFMLFGLLSAFNYAFTIGTDMANANRLVTIHKISLIQPLPISYLQRIRALPGVEDVTHANWFGGYYQDQRNQAPQFPVDAASYLRLYPELELPDAQREAWLADRAGMIVGSALAEQFDWSVGDRIPIQATIWTREDGGRTWEFVIDGIFTMEEGRGGDNFMLFHYDYFNEARAFGEDMVGWYVLRVADSADPAQVAAAIDAQFANSFAETKTSTERAFAESFVQQFGDIGLIVSAVLGAVFFTILLVAGNTMAHAVRERIPEMAVLKTVGFSNGSVLALVLTESIVIAVLGGSVGLGLSWLALESIPAAVSNALPGLFLPPQAIGTGLLYMLAVGVAAGILPALQAGRLTIAEALRRA
ncbi:MAG TPA: ABC transporter permease [Gammaproteobacteria bacterium]